jgi:outer membrane lipopolysaccharide assembly protein LptE/RlpB
MLNRIVLTEKDQIATLKVIDELKQNDIKSEMQVIANSLAESNMRKVTLDLENLQVISHDTHELLGLIIRHVRLQNIPISITGSTQFDPGILLAISEGRPQNVEQKKQEEDALRARMRDDLVQQILRRLNSVSQAPPGGLKTERFS